MDSSAEEASLVLDSSAQDDIPSGPLSPDAEQDDEDFTQEQEGEEADQSKEDAEEDDAGDQHNESLEDAASAPNDDDASKGSESQEQDQKDDTKEDVGSDQGSDDEQVDSSPRKKRAVIESDDEDDNMPTQAQPKKKKLRVDSDEEDYDNMATQAQSSNKQVLASDDEDDEQPTQAQFRKSAIMDSDEEEEDNQPTQAQTKRKAVIESEEEEDEEEDNQPTQAQRRVVIESDEEEEEKETQRSDDEDDEGRKPAKRTKIEEDSEEEGEKPNRGGDKELIADIFGESDGEEEFEGFEGKKAKEDAEEDSGDEQKEAEGAEPQEEAQDALPEISSDEDEEDDRPRKVPDGMVYDFDIMMEKKKEENYRRRKRRNIDIINDSDDIIADLIREMKAAVEEDFQLNKTRQAATQKLKLLPRVDAYLKKIDLREALLDSGILSVLTDWLTPLPDRSLPHLNIREAVLKRLLEFNVEDTERLKASGIGKAVMYLYKHPKETKDNKKRALQLIKNWSRPIFNTDTDYTSLSKEEREQRDLDLNRKARRDSTDGEAARGGSSRGNEDKPARPGEKGWVPRARVPQPSMRDYVVRPKSSVEGEVKVGRSSRQTSRLDKHLRNFMELKRKNKHQRAVKISIEGKGMLS